METIELARQKAAQAWCTPTTGSITMIPELAFAFADILVEAMDYAHIELDENLDYQQVGE